MRERSVSFEWKALGFSSLIALIAPSIARIPQCAARIKMTRCRWSSIMVLVNWGLRSEDPMVRHAS
ncbi:hypothetical protein [Burkholderia dolosa]|uniref:hypothetical protein n=1 Tax=Burkholderia dolosa TaxID=152500 RepID=UPI001BAD0157|nr:hypothetical protein [Burkholderia dolosa]